MPKQAKSQRKQIGKKVKFMKLSLDNIYIYI